MSRIAEELVRPAWFSLDYTLITDETGDKGGKLSHQLLPAIEYDAGRLGSLGGSLWFEWYKRRDADPRGKGSGDLQEVDYTVYWGYDLEAIGTSVELGWSVRTYPREPGDAGVTNEGYILLQFDDSKLLRTDEPVLCPYVAYYRDVDDAKGGWIEVGLSHTFPLSELGMDKTPFLKDVELAPSFAMCIDHAQMGKGTRAAELRFGLDVCYNLSGALKVPDEYGQVTVTGFLYFSDGLVPGQLQDQLYGGVTLGYLR